MDVAPTSFVLTIAALFAGTALAAPPSPSGAVQRTANYAGQSDWSSAGPVTPPTISASPNNRYAYPQNTAPQQQPITQRVQNGFNETATSVRNGVDASVRAAGQQFSPSATTASQQSFGTSVYPSQPSSPFATQLAAPAVNPATRGNLAPPPWPTNSTGLTPPTNPGWSDASLPVTPVDRSVLINPSTPQTGSSWTSIGSNIAAPPMLIPQLPTTASTLAPLNTTPIDNGRSFTTDSYRGGQPAFGAPTNAPPQSPPTSTVRSASAADDWAATWDASADNSRASVGRTATNTSRPSSTRDTDFGRSQSVAANPQDARKTNDGRSTDSWSDDSWSRNSPSSPSGPAASISAKPPAIGPATNSAPNFPPLANAPAPNLPTIGSAGSNPTFNGTNPYSTQQPVPVNAAKPTQPGTAPGEPQPWVTLLVTLLALAFSLAGNVYLGWSYLDARQKYQGLVRRTADTFRRTKPVAA
jgi:hypothetical protein